MFITGGRTGKVKLASILKFVTGTEKEPLLGFKMHLKFFIKTNKNNFLPSSNTCVNLLNLSRPTAEYNLPMKRLYFIYMTTPL